MLDIDLYCAADTADEGGFAQMSGCGIVCHLPNQNVTRYYGYPLGPSDSITSYANAIRLGVLSINKKMRSNAYKLRIYSEPEVLKMLSDDVVIKYDPALEGLMLKVRDIIRPFGQKEAFYDPDNVLYMKAKEIANKCQKSQKDYKG